MDDEMTLWRRAEEMDRSLKGIHRYSAELTRRRIDPTPHSRARLFQAMAAGEPILFDDFPVPMRVPGERVAALSRAIAGAFADHQRARIQAGRSRKRGSMKVPDVFDKWRRGRAILSVTDLHFRHTKVEDAIDTRRLSDFNLYVGDDELEQCIEMMTLVISTAGNVTDSHTDDSDGSNHCFTGVKLWLMWNRLDGQARGLQDLSHDHVTDSAAFDVDAFFSLDSARWLVVSRDRTLFLPGDLAHKVVTLEPYIGVGSFVASLPSYHRSLKRWLFDRPMDVTEDLLDRIQTRALRKIVALRRGPATLRERWGVDVLSRALGPWLARAPQRVARHARFRELVDALRPIAPRQSLMAI